MKRRGRTTWWATAMLAAAGAAALAFGPPPAGAPGSSLPPPNAGQPAVKPAQPPLEAKKHEGKFTGTDWHHDDASRTGTLHAFTYTEDDLLVTGDDVKYDDVRKTMEATGHLEMDDKRVHASGPSCAVQYGPKAGIAHFEGGVTITIKPKQPAAPQPVGLAPVTPPKGSPPPPPEDQQQQRESEERGRGAIITCDTVDDYYRKDYAILRGHLTLRQHLKAKDGHEVDRTMTAEHAEYDGKKEQLYLFAPVHGSDTDGQSLNFDKDVILGTKEGAESLTTYGKVHITVLRTDENGGGDGSAPQGAEPPRTPVFGVTPPPGQKPAAPPPGKGSGGQGGGKTGGG